MFPASYGNKNIYYLPSLAKFFSKDFKILVLKEKKERKKKI
jgi:hypothetical protein